MTITQFVSTYTGKFVEYHSFNPAAKNQCVDLANKYIDEVLGLSPIIGTNAQDFPKMKGSEFDYIVNTPSGLPQQGDLMIFKSADGVGHISIFIEGNLSTFRSFDQNYPVGSPCTLVSHNYRNVLGWLHPKKGSMNMYKGYDLANPESMKVAVDVLVRLQAGELVEKKDYIKKSEYDVMVTSKDATIAQLQAKLAACESQPASPVVDMSKWEVNGMQITQGDRTFNYKLK